MLADQDDISIETDLYCKELLGEEYSITTDESVTYQKDGTAINITYTTPDDSDYSVEAVAAGRTCRRRWTLQRRKQTYTLSVI